MKIDRPLKLEENRVSRIYKGGALIDRFLGKNICTDGFFPENWIGSDTAALGDTGEGISQVIIDGENVALTTLITEHPEALFGTAHRKRIGDRTGVLVKELDSLIRLPIQSHPDRAFSKKYLSAEYGKTETWYILGGRTIDGVPPHVYLGFTENADKASFRRAYDEQDVPAMLSMLNKVCVKEHDFFIIPGRVPHAIGSGVFCIEVQEPSDFVFQLDKKGPCWDLTPAQVHMDLGDDRMFESFDLDGARGASLLRSLASKSTGDADVDLLNGKWREFFGVRILTVTASISYPVTSFAIAIIMDGEGRFDGTGIRFGKGDAFIIPYAAKAVNIMNGGASPVSIFIASPPILCRQTSSDKE
ncbi:MAG: hypothetical protein AABZ39_06795 [Spirochaetota bacterium]